MSCIVRDANSEMNREPLGRLASYYLVKIQHEG